MSKGKKDSDPRWTSELPPAPGELRIVQAFVNTATSDHTTEFRGPLELVDWLERWGLVPPGTKLDDGDLERVKKVREAMRKMLVAHGGGPVPDAVVQHLDRVVEPAVLRVRFEAGGRACFEPVKAGLDGALARLCGVVALAQVEDTWRHLKICARGDCGAAFFDFSRNHSGVWCSKRCGSRLSSKVYRRRNLKRLRESERHSAWARREARRMGV